MNVAEFVPRRARRDTAPTTMFDVVKGFARRVPLAKLLEMDPDVRPYLAAIIVDAVRKMDDVLCIPSDMKVN